MTSLNPAVQVLVAATPWPPPGPLALVLAPLVYTDLAGAGGHGGEGRTADTLQQLRGLVTRLQPLLMDLASCRPRPWTPPPPPAAETAAPPLTSLGPAPAASLVPAFPLTPAVSRLSQSQQLSETETLAQQRRGLLRLCECPGLRGVCSLL